MKIRTVNQLQNFLDHEFSWRLKEIADIKSMVRSSTASRRNTMIRAGIPLLYAHWEGFIKNSSQGYLNYVNCMGLKYEDLTSCFIVFGLKKKLDSLIPSKQSQLNIETVDFLLTELSKTAALQLHNAVDTESNLKSKVFENIARSIGIDPTPFEAKYNLIDESLLDRRNRIAHGEYLDLDTSSYRSLADEIIGLMRGYKNDIENAAMQDKYKR